MNEHVEKVIEENFLGTPLWQKDLIRGVWDEAYKAGQKSEKKDGFRSAINSVLNSGVPSNYDPDPKFKEGYRRAMKDLKVKLVDRLNKTTRKRCRICKEEKLISEFYKDMSRWDALSMRCKKCDSRRREAYRVKAGLVEEVKVEARRQLRLAVRQGKIKKLPCEVCGHEKSQGHHPDYSKPLEAIWLCQVHHQKKHQELRATHAEEDKGVVV